MKKFALTLLMLIIASTLFAAFNPAYSDYQFYNAHDFQKDKAYLESALNEAKDDSEKSEILWRLSRNTLTLTDDIEKTSENKQARLDGYSKAEALAQESVDLVDKIYTLLNDFLTQKMDVDAVIDKFIEYLTQYKNYLQNKIQKTSTIQLNDLNHAKTLNRVQKFFEIPNAYISNIDEIVDELIYSNLDTALTKFLAVVYQVQVDTNIEAFANKDKQFLLLPINILSLLLLTKKGKQAISLGDPVFYLKTMSSNSYKLTAYVLDDFKIISSYIRLLPKEVVEEKITDNNQIYSKIGQNSKELDFILLKNMQELSTSDSYAWTLFKDKFIFVFFI